MSKQLIIGIPPASNLYTVNEALGRVVEVGKSVGIEVIVQVVP